VYTPKQDIQKDIIQSFCMKFDKLPSVYDLKDVLLKEFNVKIPIRDQFYSEWKNRNIVLDNYFQNEDVQNKTAYKLSSRCESAMDQVYSGSETALVSKYDNLIRNIWDVLKEV